LELHKETKDRLREPTPETLDKMERIKKALDKHLGVEQIYEILGNCGSISISAILLIDIYSFTR